MNGLQIMVSIDGSVKHCSFWNICNICRVLSARAVGRAWTGNSRTDSPSNRFYASLATRMFHLPWIKTVFFSAFWQSHHCWQLKMMHHCSLYWSSVKSFLANCFLIIGDHFRLHFYNIPQCQLTISWVAMVTCGPIVFPKVLWMQHLRIIFDFNALDMMQIFKSIPMVVNWYKTEIAQYFHKWCFFYIYYQTENMNRKGIMLVKASEGTAMPCGFTRHPQHGMGKSPSKCYNY